MDFEYDIFAMGYTGDENFEVELRLRGSVCHIFLNEAAIIDFIDGLYGLHTTFRLHEEVDLRATILHEDFPNDFALKLFTVFSYEPGKSPPDSEEKQPMNTTMAQAFMSPMDRRVYLPASRDDIRVAFFDLYNSFMSNISPVTVFDQHLLLYFTKNNRTTKEA